MRILFLVSQLPYPPDTGAKIRVFNLVKRLCKLHQITLVTYASENDKEKIAVLKEFCSDIKVINRKDKPLAVGLLLNLFSGMPYSVKKYYSTQMKELLGNLTGSGKFDLIHCDSLQMSLNVLAQNSVPKLLTEHNIESLILKRYAGNEKNLIKRLLLYHQYRKLQAYEKNACAQFDHCVAVSEEEKDFIRDVAKAGNVSVVANGVDCKYFIPQGRQAEQVRLVFTGSLDWYPNDDGLRYFFDDIYPLIKEKVPQVDISVVGRNPSKDILRYSKKDSSIKIVGRVDDVRKPIAESAVFVVPLRIGGGTRLKILEAMAMAKPVVSTVIGAEGIQVTAGENILLADKPQDFAAEVIRLLNDPSLRDSIGAAGRKLVEDKYDWSICAAELDRIWKGLAKNK